MDCGEYYRIEIEDTKDFGPIETACCGTITRCGGRCLTLGELLGATKCTRCKWIWEVPPGQEGYPLSNDDMRRAHE